MTAFNVFGPDKMATDGVSAVELNTYLRDNLLHLKEHHDALGGVHGIDAAVYAAGIAAGAGYFVQGVRSAEQLNPAESNHTLSLTWPVAFPTAAVAVLHTVEVGGAGSSSWADECLTAVSATGCDFFLRTFDTDAPWWFRGNVIAFGH